MSETATSRRERLALASAGIPFRLKSAVVWAAIFAALAFFFALAQFDTDWMLDNVLFILGGVQYTLLIAVSGIVLAVVLALLGALARLSSNPVAFGVAGFYVSFFRGTPLIVQMFLLYLALPQIGTNLVSTYPGFPEWLANRFVLTATAAGILALGLNYGAYMTEIFRAGIQSVAAGQGEAADALGMTYRQKMRRVVLPQALRVIIPPTGNEFIAMMKDTALVSFLGWRPAPPRCSASRSSSARPTSRTSRPTSSSPCSTGGSRWCSRSSRVGSSAAWRRATSVPRLRRAGRTAAVRWEPREQAG